MATMLEFHNIFQQFYGIRIVAVLEAGKEAGKLEIPTVVCVFVDW